MLSIISLLVLLVAGGLWGYRSEKRAFNGGTCRVCFSPLRHFDTDSQGGRGYVCHNRHHIWVSWPGTDKVEATNATP